MNKEVCRRCKDASVTFAWDRNDNVRWSNGFVLCHQKTRSQPDWIVSNWEIDVAGNPPEVCAYKLEHLVLGQES